MNPRRLFQALRASLFIACLMSCLPGWAANFEIHQPEPQGCFAAYVRESIGLSLTEAADVVGQPPFGDQLKRAVRYILTKNYDKSDLKQSRARDLDDLLFEIRRHSHGRSEFGIFDYTQTTGSDGSVVFNGSLAIHALVVAPDGRLFRGEIRPHLYGTKRVWPADYSKMRELQPL